VPDVLLHLLVVLVCAKAAAEVSERIGLPAVAGEIVAGVLIGPSVLGLVGHDEVLRVLGELGVLLLLLDVGLQMDLRELRAVGTASASVAVVGVALPFAGGYGAAAALGLHGHAPLFLGAALTATSVGVTARVFADLRALATVEARTVLGAAVADDVLGLVVLAVVVKVVTAGHVSPLGVLGIAALAVAFLVVATGAGSRLVPYVMHHVGTRSRAPGTVLAIALAATLGFAELARLSGLAPIVGAFVAGVCLAGMRGAGELRRDLQPLGHVFVPVFFLQIGIDADVRAFAHPKVVGLAAALFAVAVVGKVAAGVVGGRADRLAVGLGMIPRGEVGLIFAAVGLREGVLSADTYGALLLVVLLSTVVGPPLLRWRILTLSRDRGPAAASSGPPPPGGWLAVSDGAVDLAATPSAARLLLVGLDAARLAAEHRPGDRLLDWLAEHADDAVPWTPQATAPFLSLLAEGNARSWHLLDATGLLDRALPELTGRRYRWATLERLRAVLHVTRLDHPEWALVAALAIDGDVAAARRLVRRLDLGAKAEQEVALLVGEPDLFRAATARADALTERVVVALADHVADRERAAALYLVSLARGPLDDVERERLRELYDLVDGVLARGPRGNAVEQRRAAALRLVEPGSAAAQRIQAAPPDYLLGETAVNVATDAALLASGAGMSAGGERVAVVVHDRVGALADVLERLPYDVRDAVAAVWPDGVALLVLTVSATLGTPPQAHAVEGADLAYDDNASPWHTLVRVVAPDQPGLLASVARAFARAGVDVHRARCTTRDGRADDVFEVTDTTGRKLSRQQRDAVARNLATGRAKRHANRLGTRRKHRGHRRETAAS
jgi:Kef-type K+ transport system membrane component KefB